ncbi:hypothetical protein [Prevotella falsenii]|uniref:hypothetical protein n=1 Tax=Prevotella falsenii TaxID=515414 RepID=UPI0004688A66|nr:hypothetical protein [Prevotella falsenii]
MKADKKLTPKQRRNLQFSEDRLGLLDTIREMIDIEFERRAQKGDSKPCRERPPLKSAANKSQESDEPEDSGLPPHQRTLWQRILKMFTCCFI